jgi:uncharacterized LabA/DUF88 family protein
METNDVAIFLDLDNLLIGSRQAGLHFDIRRIVDYLKEMTRGRVVLRRAYGDWRQNGSVPEELATVGFELQSTVRLSEVSKNLADMQMVVDAMDTLVDGHHFSTYVIMTGDRDFTPLVQGLRRRGKKVIGVGVKHTASQSLMDLCDHYLFYEEIIRAQEGAFQNDSGLLQRRDKLDESRDESELALFQRYRTGLQERGIPVPPAEVRLAIVRDLLALLHEKGEVLWGDVISYVHERRRQDRIYDFSKDVINSTLIAVKRSRAIYVSRGETLSTAPVTLDLEAEKPFQESVMRLDATYLAEIQQLDLPFDLETATQLLYENDERLAYLRYVHRRFNRPE